jgi:lambda family phage portal protein
MKLISSLANRITSKRKQIAQLKAQVQSQRARIADLQKRSLLAAANNRLLEDWTLRKTSLNDDIQAGLVTARFRSRQLAKEDDYGKKFIGLCKSNIVGPEGLKLEMNIRDDNGKIDQKAQDKVKLAWEKFTNKKNFLASQDMDFFDAQHLIASTLPPDGEFFVRKIKGYPHNPFKFALQIIETDCVDEQKRERRENGNAVFMGVERDEWKRRVAYWIKKENPYDSGSGFSSGKLKSEPVSATEIIHGFVPVGVNQVRGLPWFVSPAPRMQMLNGYEEAAIVAARTAACKMGFLEEKPDAAGNYAGAGVDEDGNKIMEASPGSIEQLPQGFTFHAWDPSHPHTEHGSFIKTTLRGISAGLLVSYNSLANDLEGVNYSSIRAGLIDERDMWKIVQRWLIQHLWNDVFESFLEMAILSGQLDLPRYKFDKFNQPAFIPRRWPWVDPEKDIKAAILAIENGLDTRTDNIAERGGSIDENFDTLEHEQKLAESKGLNFTGLKGYAEQQQPQNGSDNPASA